MAAKLRLGLVKDLAAHPDLGLINQRGQGTHQDIFLAHLAYLDVRHAEAECDSPGRVLNS